MDGCVGREDLTCLDVELEWFVASSWVAEEDGNTGGYDRGAVGVRYVSDTYSKKGWLRSP